MSHRNHSLRCGKNRHRRDWYMTKMVMLPEFIAYTIMCCKWKCNIVKSQYSIKDEFFSANGFLIAASPFGRYKLPAFFPPYETPIFYLIPTIRPTCYNNPIVIQIPSPIHCIPMMQPSKRKIDAAECLNCAFPLLSSSRDFLNYERPFKIRTPLLFPFNYTRQPCLPTRLQFGSTNQLFHKNVIKADFYWRQQ